MRLGGAVRLVMYGTVDRGEICESDKTDKVPEIDECYLIGEICEIGESAELDQIGETDAKGERIEIAGIVDG